MSLRLSGLPQHHLISSTLIIFVWLKGHMKTVPGFVYLFSPETTYNFAGFVAAILSP